MTAVPEIMLNNGRTIPQFGFGVFQVQPEETVAAVSTALEAGYRHIDTAEMYGNEREVGEAIRKSGLDRSDVFVTSKLSNDAHRPDDARRAFDASLEALGFDYLDLFLIHWPLPTRYDGDYPSTWKVLEEFYRDGRARSVGVSNFQPHHLRRLHEEAEITPAVNQIEVHPYLTQDDVRAFCAEHQIAIEGWSPIGQGQVLDDPDDRHHRPAAGPHPGPGGAALAHRARRHHLPEVRHPGADPGEHRHFRLRAHRGRRRGHQRAEPEPAFRPGPRQVRHGPGLIPVCYPASPGGVPGASPRGAPRPG